MKRHVGEKYTTFKIADVKLLTEERFALVPSDLWRSAGRHCLDLVENLWVADNVRDEVAEPAIEIDGQEEGEKEKEEDDHDGGGGEEEEEEDDDDGGGEEKEEEEEDDDDDDDDDDDGGGR